MAWFLVHFWGISPVDKLFLRQYKVVNQSQTTNFSENLSFATKCSSFWQQCAWVLIFLSFYLLEFFHKMRNDKPVLNVEGLRNPMQKFHILAMFFFGPAIIPYSELADYQVFGKILWCFVINIDFSCAKIHDFFLREIKVFLRNGQETSLILYNGNRAITTKTKIAF